MKKTIIPMLRQGFPFYLLSFCFVLGFGLFGTVFFEIVMRVSESHTEEPKTFEMAFLMSLIAFMGLIFLFSMLMVQRHFQSTVGMSRTRKSFFAGSLLCSAVAALFGIAALFISALTEQLRLRYWWSGYACESRYLASFTPAVLLFFLFAFVVLSQLMGALFLRFGKLAFWVLWVMWMVGALFFPIIKDDLEEKRHTVFATVGHIFTQVITSLPLFAWLLIGTGVLCILLFLSYRMILRQQVD